MSTQIVFAIGYTDFEKQIIIELNNRTEPRKYLSVFSATHLDNILEKCIQLRPQILVIRDSMASPKQDFLGLIRQLRMSVTGLRIIVLTKQRQPGDPLMTGLMAFGIYDVLARDSFSAADIANLILNPRKIQDMAAYVPKATLENDSNMLSFSASDDGVSPANSNTTILNDVSDDTPNSALQSENVNHTEKLVDIHEKEESNLYTESKPSGPVVMGKGMKLGYHPLFAAVSEDKEHVAEKIRKTESLHQNMSSANLQTSIKKQTDMAIETKNLQSDASVNGRKVNTSVREETINAAQEQQSDSVQASRQHTINQKQKTNSSHATPTPAKVFVKIETPPTKSLRSVHQNEQLDKPFFEAKEARIVKENLKQSAAEKPQQKEGNENMSQFDPKDAIKDRLKGINNNNTDTGISAPPVHPKKTTNDDQRRIMEQQRAQAEQTVSIPLRPKMAPVGQPVVQKASPQQTKDSVIEASPTTPKEENLEEDVVATQKPLRTERKDDVRSKPMMQNGTSTQKQPQTHNEGKESSSEKNFDKQISDNMFSLFEEAELQQIKNILKDVILRHSKAILGLTIGDDSISDNYKAALDQLVQFSKQVNQAVKK